MSSKILKNMSWLTVSNLAVKPLWFIFITYGCIYYMGLAQYGVMTAALALMSICDGSLTLGSSPYTIRELSRTPERSSEFFSNLLLSRIGMSLIAVILGLVIRIMLGTGALDVVLFAGGYVLARNVLEYCRALFRAHEIFQYEAWSTMLEKVLVIGAGMWALTVTPSAASALMGMSLGMAVTFLLTFAWVTRGLAPFNWHLVSGKFFREALPQAVPLGLSSIFVLLYYRTDSIMIEAFDGDLVTGQYGLAFRITEAMVLLPYIVTSVLLPRLSSLYASDGAAFGRLFKQGIAGMALTAGLAGSAVYLLAPWGIPLIDSSVDALPAIPLLRILVISFVISAINQMMITHLTATNQQNRLAVILAIAAVLNIGLNLLLIPRFSAQGAAFATVATQILLGLLFFAQMQRGPTKRTA